MDTLEALPAPATVDPDLSALQARIRRGEDTIVEARAVAEAWRRHRDAKDQQVTLAAKVAELEVLVEQLGPKGARVEALAAAVSVFEAAWHKVEQSGSKLASPAYKRAAQEIIAKRIIEMAQRGERDPDELADDAVSYLDRSYA